MQYRLRSQNGQRWLLVVTLAIAGLLIAAVVAIIIPSLGSTTSADTASTEDPVQVEPVEGTDLSQVILSEHAAQRLGIETAPAQVEQIEGEEFVVVPYSSVVYDTVGDTWVYTNPESLVFVRESVTVERIDGDRAFLSEGPSPDTLVATVGVAELYGSEFGVGH